MRKKWKTTHAHHIIPRHMGGTDDPSNLIELTIEEHAEAHRILFEQHGNIRDKIAWLCLAGRGKEAEPYRIKLANDGFQKFLSDPQKSTKWKEKIAKSITGKKRTEESIKKQSETTKELYRTGQIKPPELTDERREMLKTNFEKFGCANKMADGRKNSQKWRESVTSEASKLVKSEADPRSQRISINGVIYPSVRRAVKFSGVEVKLIGRAKSLGGTYIDEHNHITFL